MLKAQSFSEILNEINTENMNFSNEISSNANGFEEVTSIYGFSQILGTTPTYKFNLKSRYPRNPSDAIKVKAHLLNDSQTAAFNFFIRMGLQLSPSFNSKELKIAYRQAVLKTHPDQGGSSEIFQETRNSFEILSALVKNKS